MAAKVQISCPECKTRYRVDSARLAGRTLSFKCAKCANTFDAKPVTEDESPKWVVTLAESGERLEVPNGGVLKKWIQSGRVGPNDTLGKDDKPGKRLGNLKKFKALFPSDAPPIPEESKAAPRPKVPSEDHSAVEDVEDVDESSDGDEWDYANLVMENSDEPIILEVEEQHTSRAGIYLFLAVVVGLLGLGLGIVYALDPETFFIIFPFLSGLVLMQHRVPKDGP